MSNIDHPLRHRPREQQDNGCNRVEEAEDGKFESSADKVIGHGYHELISTETIEKIDRLIHQSLSKVARKKLFRLIKGGKS